MSKTDQELFHTKEYYYDPRHQSVPIRAITPANQGMLEHFVKHPAVKPLSFVGGILPDIPGTEAARDILARLQTKLNDFVGPPNITERSIAAVGIFALAEAIGLATLDQLEREGATAIPPTVSDSIATMMLNGRPLLTVEKPVIIEVPSNYLSTASRRPVYKSKIHYTLNDISGSKPILIKGIITSSLISAPITRRYCGPQAYLAQVDFGDVRQDVRFGVWNLSSLRYAFPDAVDTTGRLDTFKLPLSQKQGWNRQNLYLINFEKPPGPLAQIPFI